MCVCVCDMYIIHIIHTFRFHFVPTLCQLCFFHYFWTAAHLLNFSRYVFAILQFPLVKLFHITTLDLWIMKNFCSLGCWRFWRTFGQRLPFMERHCSRPDWTGQMNVFRNFINLEMYIPGSVYPPAVYFYIWSSVVLQEVFQPRDCINYRYHYKRAYYITWLASSLKLWEHTEQLQFVTKHDVYKPILQIKLKGG